MRIAELSRCTMVPIPTIKFYIREGLLLPGERTSPNQAQYDEGHVRRLKLVRALIDVGGLSVAATRDVLEKMNTPGMSPLEAAGKAQFAMTVIRPPIEDEAWHKGRAQADELIDRIGWNTRESNPARQALASVLATFERLGQRAEPDLLADYARAAERVAELDIDKVEGQSDAESMAESLVIWTALGDVLTSALRRLAHENVAMSRLLVRPALGDK